MPVLPPCASNFNIHKNGETTGYIWVIISFSLGSELYWVRRSWVMYTMMDILVMDSVHRMAGFSLRSSHVIVCLFVVVLRHSNSISVISWR